MIVAPGCVYFLRVPCRIAQNSGWRNSAQKVKSREGSGYAPDEIFMNTSLFFYVFRPSRMPEWDRW
jgi:hypothetical protein